MGSKRFQPGEGPSRSLLRDNEPLDGPSFQALLADEMMIFCLQTIFNVIQYSSASASLNMNTFYMLLKEFLSQCKMQVLNAMLDI